MTVKATLLIDLADLAADLAGIEQALERWKALDAKALKNGGLNATDEAERSSVSATYTLHGQFLLGVVCERVRQAR
ncbi:MULTISPECIES: hypothetical protein [Pseudomonas syringae group]|uniref:Uncharacterized protein n=2 Tax=Pseudomonas syringae group TaxID=136849 RepID=A0A0P9RMB7_9PSED|nr:MULTISPECIES: hypothetical protein [Pseudomonas syringae group]EGH74121.1 hypothetical protein PSYAR_26574 [Pseudomonas syringae pv. aceris str. M302273]KOG05744.1 Uncharacterized protein ABJ98_4527 [Pseudomonas syringae pv. aceris]KPW08424.1 hypothetical protein ALO91_200037 [Pseudomonas syringae pv. aceris]KPX46933.1 hypothetical protein ALO68_200117 [Pseudomonas syringae pv. helianthi]RMN71009.1 hypothetical protein ALQ54_200004 [Pseudomonas syringae]